MIILTGMGLMLKPSQSIFISYILEAASKNDVAEMYKNAGILAALIISGTFVTHHGWFIILTLISLFIGSTFDY